MEPTTNTATAASGSPATAQPASPQGAPQTPAASGGTDPRPVLGSDELIEAWNTPEPAEQSGATPEPANAGDPGAGEPTETAPAASGGTPETADTTGKAGTEPLPGDDLITEFEKALGKPEGTEPAGSAEPVIDPLDTDEKIAKAIDPDGKADPVTRLKNAQQLLGRQGKELGTARQQVRQWEEAIAGLQGVFQQDKATGQIKPTAAGITKLAQNIPQEELTAELAKAGVKIVPVDWQQAEQVDVQGETDLKEIVEKLKPGDDLTFEEKLAEIDGNPQQRFALQRELARREAARVSQTREQKAAAEFRRQQRDAQSEAEIKGFFAELKKLPYYEAELRPAIEYWNNKIPVEGDGALRGKDRLAVLKQLAYAARVPKLMRDLRDQVRSATEKSQLKKLGLAVFPSGEVPTHVEPGSNDDPRDKAETAARSKGLKAVFAEAAR